MENRRFNIKPEVEREIVKLVNSDGWLDEWLYWLDEVQKGDQEYERLFRNASPFLRFEVKDSSGNIESLYPLLNHIWRNKAYGSIAHSEISDQSLRDQFELLASVTREIDTCLQNNLSPGHILDKTTSIEDGRGDLRALRLRAIAVMSRLEFPSFFAANHFNSLTALLGIEVSFPYQATDLMYQLSEYLPEEFRSNKYVRFIFPWIIYQEFNTKKNSGSDTDNKPPAESNEPVLPPQNNSNNPADNPLEKQYWWLNFSRDQINSILVSETTNSNLVKALSIEKDIPLNEVRSGAKGKFPKLNVSYNLLEDDLLFWADPDGKSPQLVIRFLNDDEIDLEFEVIHVYNFPINYDELYKDPLLKNNTFLIKPDFNSPLTAISQDEFNAIIGINNSIEEKIQAQNESEKFKKQQSTVASRLHSDGETTEDKLNYRLYATAIAQIIRDERTKPPVNIAIVAPWGHGKTTLMEFLREKFEDRSKWKPKIATGVKMTVKALYDGLKSMLGKVQQGQNVLETKRLEYPTVWFNPWKYQSSEQIWAGVGHALITQLIGKYEPEEQERIWLRLRLKRIDRNEIRKDIHKRMLNSWLPWLAASLITIVSGMVYSFLKPDNIIAQSTVATGFIAAVVSGYLNWKKEQKSEVDGKLADYIREPDYTAKLGVFHEINEDLKIVAGELIDPAKPAIVFIDDLDRCTPKTVAEVFEAVNLMMTGELKDRCYFVIGMDAQMVAAALDTEYNSWAGRLPDQERRHGSVGWYFLDKFIQLPFFIPVMDPKKRRDFISELFRDSQTLQTENTVLPNAAEIEKAATEFVGLKGENIPSVFEVLRNTDKVQFQQVQEMVVEKAIEQSKDSSEIDKAISGFSDFLDTSPRGIKRFANLLRFYDSQRIVRRMNAGASQNEFPEFDVLARWLVINLRWPQMVRWIQWEREEVLLYTVDPERKAEFIDKMIEQVVEHDEKIRFDKWKELLDAIGLHSKKHLLWLYDRDLFALLISNTSSEAGLKKALECDVW